MTEKFEDEKKVSEIDFSNYRLILDLNYTTYAHVEQNGERNMAMNLYKHHTNWGESVSLNASIGFSKIRFASSKITFMDKYVKEVCDYFLERNAKITFSSPQGEYARERIIGELAALGIENPDLLVRGTSSQTKAFLREINNNEIIIVLDDEIHNLKRFNELFGKKSNKKLLFRYSLLKDEEC